MFFVSNIRIRWLTLAALFRCNRSAIHCRDTPLVRCQIFTAIAIRAIIASLGVPNALFSQFQDFIALQNEFPAS